MHERLMVLCVSNNNTIELRGVVKGQPQNKKNESRLVQIATFLATVKGISELGVDTDEYKTGTKYEKKHPIFLCVCVCSPSLSSYKNLLLKNTSIA